MLSEGLRPMAALKYRRTYWVFAVAVGDHGIIDQRFRMPMKRWSDFGGCLVRCVPFVRVLKMGEAVEDIKLCATGFQSTTPCFQYKLRL